MTATATWDMELIPAWDSGEARVTINVFDLDTPMTDRDGTEYLRVQVTETSGPWGDETHIFGVTPGMNMRADLGAEIFWIPGRDFVGVIEARGYTVTNRTEALGV